MLWSGPRQARPCSVLTVGDNQPVTTPATRTFSPWPLAGLLACGGIGLGCPASETSPPPPPPVAKSVKTPPKAKAPPKAPPPATPPPPPPYREAGPQEIKDTLAKLEEWVRPGLTDPKNPWALAHGLTAFGNTLITQDKRKAVDVIVEDFAKLEQMSSRSVFGFAPKTEEGLPLEPHPDLMVKSLVESGLPLKIRFSANQSRGGQVTLKRLVEDAAWAFTPPKTDQDWHQFAWSYALFVQAFGLKPIETQAGPQDLAALTDRALARLEKEQAFLLKSMQQNRPDLVQKRKQGIYGHSCGGLHFLNAVVLGAKHRGRAEDLARAKKQLDILVFRWEAERRIYRRMKKQYPKHRLLLLVQELKFYGHALESLALAHERGLLDANETVKQTARRIAADLIDTVWKLQNAYIRQEGIRQTSPQVYYDLIGDGAHAIRGLRRGLVAFFAS